MHRKVIDTDQSNPGFTRVDLHMWEKYVITSNQFIPHRDTAVQNDTRFTKTLTVISINIYVF